MRRALPRAAVPRAPNSVNQPGQLHWHSRNARFQPWSLRSYRVLRSNSHCVWAWRRSWLVVPLQKTFYRNWQRLPIVLAVLGSIPRINHRHVRFIVIASITGDDSKTVLDRCRGDKEIRLREGVADFSAFFNQNPPFQHDVFRHLENPLVKHRPYFMCEPIIQLDATVGFPNKPNPKRISARVITLI